MERRHPEGISERRHLDGNERESVQNNFHYEKSDTARAAFAVKMTAIQLL
jgi:hypothetical protein